MGFRGGYVGKILREDLSAKTTRAEDRNGWTVEKPLGGRRAETRYFFREIGLDVDPLGSQNKLIFFTNPLTGAGLPATRNIELPTRSPEIRIQQSRNIGRWLIPFTFTVY